jgi:hypothetical protein
MDYTEHNEKIEVPKQSGVEGFLHALKAILTLPNVKKIEITSNGEVAYRYFLPKEAATTPLKVNFESLEPYAVVRNAGLVTELAFPDYNAAVAIAQLFSMAAQDHLHPLALVGGTNSDLWAWYEETTSIKLFNKESLFGLPYLGDRKFEDGVLILCAGFARDGSLIDTHKSYKLCIPQTKVVNVIEAND